MVGHGGPKTSRGRHLPAARTTAAVGRCALVVLCMLAAHTLQADDIRVRIAWGGGTDRVWHGTISVSDGSLSDPQPLGVEADEPGSMWLDGDSTGSRRLSIEQRSPRGYDGVDVSVAASASAKLRIQLSASDDSTPGAVVETPLTEITAEFVNKELDNRGNRLLLMRAPGDSLRVSLSRDSLVFAPGETFKFSLEPRAPPLGRARPRADQDSTPCGRQGTVVPTTRTCRPAAKTRFRSKSLCPARRASTTWPSRRSIIRTGRKRSASR